MRIVRQNVASALFIFILNVSSAYADTWRGTAPFCAGSCNSNEEQVGVSDYGDGGYCVTGHKVLCRNASAMCKGRETKASCYGVVMVCDNGYHETLNNNWHSCNSYGCGLCIGFGSSSTHPQSTTGGGTTQRPDICKSGYVWREALKGDHVCVVPAVRAQAAADNAAAAGRRSAGGGASGPDTCLQGFVWREATAADHVCVPPATRAAAAEDNRHAGERVNSVQATPVLDATCKQGFVWREAIRDDRVCVTPATRSQAADDNAHAGERRASQSSPPDACKPGFVWREVVPSDHVCVRPEVRGAAAQDTALARTRLAR